MICGADDWDAAQAAREDAARARCEALAPGVAVSVWLCCERCGESYACAGRVMGPKAMFEAEALEGLADKLESMRSSEAEKSG